MEAQSNLGDSTGVVSAHIDLAHPFLLRALASMEEIGSHLVVASMQTRTHEQPRANKTDAGNGSKAICRVSNVLRSPSPDPKRSAKKTTQ